MGQDYYKRVNLMINLEGDRAETYTFETYGWTEHISRKTGQWLRTPKELTSQLEKCGFDVSASDHERIEE